MPIEPAIVEKMRQHLITRRAELLERRDRVDLDLARGHEPLVADSSDQAIQVQNDEPLQAIGEAAADEIAAIDAALERIANGLYGTCKRCGGQIPPRRLAAVPYAVNCADCASN